MMHTPARVGLWFGLGVLLLLVALFLQSVTVASQRYEGILLTALTLVTAADVCLIQAYRHGNQVIRVLSVLFLLPTLYVVADFIRRAPHLFYVAL